MLYIIKRRDVLWLNVYLFVHKLSVYIQYTQKCIVYTLVAKAWEQINTYFARNVSSFYYV